MFNPYKTAYVLILSKAASCSIAKQPYINGHFCYADKSAIPINGLSIVRHISLLDDDLQTAYLEKPMNLLNYSSIFTVKIPESGKVNKPTRLTSSRAIARIADTRICCESAKAPNSCLL